MKVVVGVIIFLYGLVFGSFYNVVGYRVPKKISLVNPGSFCPNCHHKLKWYELVPLFSFIFQGGKCTNCKKKISLFYPIIESLTGILFLVSYLNFGITPNFFISLIISSFLVIVIVSDGRYMIIPDEVTLFFSVLLVVINLCTLPLEISLKNLLSGIIMVALMYLFMLICNFVFKKESLGGGDIKLMFFIGNAIGFYNSLFAIFVASVIALPISLIYLKLKKSNVFPFGPFLLGGTLIVFLMGIDIIKVLTTIY